MAEYIERDAVHDLVRSLTKYALASPDKTRHRITVDADDVDFGVDKIPSADVAPVRHGWWINHTMIDGHIHAECSECHKVRIIDNYCSHCGCRMDGGIE